MRRMKAWDSKQAVEQYAREANVVIPERREMLRIISKLATDGTSDSPTIADLGCGFGDLTAAMLEWRPEAIIEMVDFSDEMMQLSRSRFKGNPRIKIASQDLNLGLPNQWKDIRFDSFASCTALHYIEPQNRPHLYGEIWNRLKEGGIFVNGDLFNCDSPSVDRWEFDDRIEWMLPRMREEYGEELSFEDLKKARLEYRKSMGEKPGTIWQMHDDMKGAGFRNVDCLWKNQCFAILAAIK